jgi:hypothetical protein
MGLCDHVLCIFCNSAESTSPCPPLREKGEVTGHLARPCSSHVVGARYMEVLRCSWMAFSLLSQHKMTCTYSLPLLSPHKPPHKPPHTTQGTTAHSSLPSPSPTHPHPPTHPRCALPLQQDAEDKSVLMYRAMIGLGKYSTVKAEINEDASSDLQAVKRLAVYLHRKADRATAIEVPRHLFASLGMLRRAVCACHTRMTCS